MAMTSRKYLPSLVFLAAILAVPVAAFAQATASSSLFGTITDPGGSPIPDAEVKITAEGTNAERVVKSNGEGSFVAPQLPPGTYSIQVSKQGFNLAKSAGVVVRTNETVRRNFQLEIGSVATSVDVSARGELTNTYTAQLSQTVDQKRVVELPLNGRDVTQLTLLAPGATVTDASTAFYAGTSGFDTTTAVINGNRTQSNTYMLDGMGNQFMERRVANIYPNPDAVEEFTLNTSQYSAEMGGNRTQSNTYMLDGMGNQFMERRVANIYPNPDAVEEFTLNTSQYSAEMGGNPGGQLSAVTKKGTNQLHGSLFEFVRNGRFNARNALDTRGKNDGLKRNQYGWAVGGPLYIPKIIDGRNRFFWMNSYQSSPVRLPGTPGFHQSWTRKEKDGDFTEHLTGRTRQVPSPACNGSLLTVDTGTIFDPLTANSTCGALGTPFPGNLIPRTRLDPVMGSILSKHTPDSPALGFLIPHFIPAGTDQWQVVNRGDAILGKHNLMGRYIYGNKFGASFNDPKDALWNVGINDGGNTTKAVSWAVTDTWTVSPGVLVTGGFGFMKNPFALTPHPFLTSWSAHGSDIKNDPKCQDLNFGVAGRDGIRVWDRCSAKDTHSWEINSAVKWVRAKHDIAIGGLYSKHWNANPNEAGSLQSGGGFSFTNAFTGIAAADAVMGLASNYTAGNFGPITLAKSFRILAGLYFNDNFRVTRKLTLNLGVRWDPGTHSRDDIRTDGTRWMSWIYPGRQSQRYTKAPPGILYWGDPDTPNTNAFARLNQFAPRFGFAYDPRGDSKWAIRGGIGGYFGQMQAGGFGLGGAGSSAPPYPSGGISIVNPVSVKNPWLTAPFNGKVGIPIGVPAKDVTVDLPFPSQWAYDPYAKNPNTWNWSLTLERNMGGDVLLRAAYVGSRGTHLIGGYEQNLPEYRPGASSLANRQDRRADPKFQSINISTGIADSYYHSLQITGEKRYSKGITFVANYTLSKAIDTGSNDIGWSGAFGNQDPRGPWFNRGLAEFDRTHVVNASVVWDLPKMTKGNAAVRAVASNWQMSGILFLRSGNPFTPISSLGNSLSPGFSSVDRADVVPGVDWKLSGLTRDQQINQGYFNQKAFTTTALGTRGTAGRGIIRGPGFASNDFMFGRIFPIHEQVRVQFRAELFNAFNRVNLRSPVMDVDNANFGKLRQGGASDPRIMQFGLKFLF